METETQANPEAPTQKSEALPSKIGSPEQRDSALSAGVAGRLTGWRKPEFNPRRQEIDFHCERHGQTRASIFKLVNEWTGPRCLDCQQESAELQRKADEETARKQAEAARASFIETALRDSGIPGRFMGKDFAGYNATCKASKAALSNCRAYAEQFPENLRQGRGMIFCGNTGAGKTHLACAIAQHVIREHCCLAEYCRISDAIGRVKETYRKDSAQTERDVLATFLRPQLLILDEVGVQFGTDAERNIIFEIVNERYEAMKVTILVSNLALSDLAKFTGERVLDRMKENGGDMLVFDWRSHRDN